MLSRWRTPCHRARRRRKVKGQAPDFTQPRLPLKLCRNQREQRQARRRRLPIQRLMTKLSEYIGHGTDMLQTTDGEIVARRGQITELQRGFLTVVNPDTGAFHNKYSRWWQDNSPDGCPQQVLGSRPRLGVAKR